MKRFIFALSAAFILAHMVFVEPGAAADDLRGVKVWSASKAGLADYDPSRFHALVIGIDDYIHWADLRTAENDANAIANVLTEDYGFPPDQVVLLLGDQATRRGILAGLDAFLELGPHDSLLIYYAGHGWMDRRKNGYWVPVDAAEEDKFGYVSNARMVQEYFKKYRVKHLWVIADSCFSGAMFRGGRATREQDWVMPAGFRKPSRYVMTSGDLVPVPDDAGTGHSPFATRLLQFLRYSDTPAFGVLDVYAFTRQTLRSEPLCQTLDTPSHMPGGEFVLCRIDSNEQRAGEPNRPAGIVSGNGDTMNVDQTRSFDLGNGEKMEMVWIPAGNFMMGSPSSENGHADDETLHRVILSKGFWMGKYEVSVGVFQQYLLSSGETSGIDLPDDHCPYRHDFSLSGNRFSMDDDQPVVEVSWEGAIGFCEWLTERERRAGRLSPNLAFRLPTEAEWEYACRAGTTGSFAGHLDQMGWHKANSGDQTHPVGRKRPNAWGVYDMHGNVWEWCLDWYGDYPSTAVTDPSGVTHGSFRVRRGGSWKNPSNGCRSANRGWTKASGTGYELGFRVVLAEMSR